MKGLNVAPISSWTELRVIATWLNLRINAIDLALPETQESLVQLIFVLQVTFPHFEEPCRLAATLFANPPRAGP